MVALYRAGRQADALREYEATRRTLGDELGLEPGPEIRRLERAILDHDPVLDWVPPPAGRRSVSQTSVSGANVVAAAPLPAPIAGLVGRVDDLVAIEDLLTRSRAVTLTGPGGSGKTRLAIEYALMSPVGRWFVDLGPVSDGAAVFNEIATAFGATIRGGDEKLSGVAALSPTGLLILDTCEHVVESAAEAVAGLLHQCPDLRVLATSRRPLEVVGELVWSVAAASTPGCQLDRRSHRNRGQPCGAALSRAGERGATWLRADRRERRSCCGDLYGTRWSATRHRACCRSPGCAEPCRGASPA